MVKLIAVTSKIATIASAASRILLSFFIQTPAFSPAYRLFLLFAFLAEGLAGFFGEATLSALGFVVLGTSIFGAGAGAAPATVAFPLRFPTGLAGAVGVKAAAAAAAALAPRPRLAGGGGGGGGGGGARGFKNLRISVRERSFPSNSNMNTSCAILG